MQVGQVEVTTHGRKEELARLVQERDDLLAKAKSAFLPFCPAINTLCIESCRCYVAPRTNLSLENGTATGMLRVYGHECDNASLVYQGPE